MSAAKVPILVLFPGLGIAYIVLLIVGEMDLIPGLRFGELSSLTPGKTLGNVLEIPIAFVIGGVGAYWFSASQSKRGLFVLPWYLGALLVYFFMPALPE